MLLGKQVALGHVTIGRNRYHFLPPLVGEPIICVTINQVSLHCFVVLCLSFNRVRAAYQVLKRPWVVYVRSHCPNPRRVRTRDESTWSTHYQD